MRTTTAAARRELAEEVGIVDATSRRCSRSATRTRRRKLIGRAYLARHDGPVTLQAEEIAWGAFVTLAEAERIARDERCCPDGLQVLRRYLDATISLR